jgi:peptidoglycan/LPS O-acetylase OafA/YrhL
MSLVNSSRPADPIGRSASLRISGLDSIRFVAAAWVVVSHLGLLPLFAVKPAEPAMAAASAFYGILVSGPAAVVVFFVVSGFCIHFPYASGQPFSVSEFILRRYIRIGVPLAAVVLLAPLAGLPLELLNRMAIWSLFSELIYYTAYPLIRISLARASWRSLLAASFAIGVAVILMDPLHASRSAAHVTWGDYPSFGVMGNALLGLPCWLLGVRLADWRTTLESRKANSNIWAWRAAIWALSCICLVARFHSPIGYPWTLNLFAIAVYLWLQQEMIHYQTSKPWYWLETAGTWSYSIYLLHPLSQALFAHGILWAPQLGDKAKWAALMMFTLGSSYAFFRMVEAPSHRMARLAARIRFTSRVPL